MNERALEIKVGIFVLAAAAILAGFAIALGDVSLGRGWQLHVEYGFAGSIHQGAPVRIAGMQAGRVSKIEQMNGDRRDENGRPLLVRLTLDLDERVRDTLREDTEFHIGTAGVLGEVYVDAITGRMEGAPLQPGAIVRGSDPPRTDLLLARVYTLVEGFSTVIDGDGEKAADLLEALTRLANSTEEVLSENREKIGSLLDKLDRTTDDLSFVASAARKQLDDGDLAVMLSQGRALTTELRRDLPELIASVRGVVGELESASATLSKLEGEDVEKLRTTIAHYEEVGKRLDTVLGDVHGIVGRIEAGEGTIGGLINDGRVYEDLRDLLDDLKENPWKLLWKR